MKKKGEVLNLMDIKNEKCKKEIINLVKQIEEILLTEFTSSDFCSCYEGDLQGIYKDGVRELINRIKEEISIEKKRGVER